MMPSAYDLLLYRGDTGRFRFVFWADSAKTDPYDLSGVTVAAQIRDKPAGLKITDLACAVTLPNIVDVTLTPVASRTLPSRGAWDLQWTYAGGDVRTVVAGKANVTDDVTDSTVMRLRRAS